MTTTDLESIYQEAIAAVPRSKEKDGGFREIDLVKEMVKRMTIGTDRDKWLTATQLIEAKTQEGTTPGAGYVDLKGQRFLFEPNRLMRGFDGWLIEWGKMNLRSTEERMRQGHEEKRKADEEYAAHEAEHAEVMALFDGLPDGLVIEQAANIKYRQGGQAGEIARKWLHRIYSANNHLHHAMFDAAVDAHPNWKRTAPGTYQQIDQSQPDNHGELVDWFQTTHPLQAREVHKAVMAELQAIEKAIGGAIVFEQIMMKVWNEDHPDDLYQPDPQDMTERALDLAKQAGHVVDRDRMYFLLSEFIRDWGPDDWKLDDDGDDDGPDDPEDPSPAGGELVGAP